MVVQVTLWTTVKLCIDPSSLLPVKYVWSRGWFDNPGLKASAEELDVFGINEPIGISLPTP